MNTSPKIFNNNIDSNKIDTETVFAKRRRNANDEESSHWLISFADLMTILLIFSFALFMVNMKENSNKSTPEEKHQNLSSRLHTQTPINQYTGHLYSLITIQKNSLNL
jgi:hypothetical protein